MTDKRLINILVDFAFKKVFAGESEQSNIILIDFLNAILELKGNDRIKEITYLNPFNDREYENDKMSIMDIKVKTEKGIQLDIEVQINDADNYKKRSLYYWSKLYGETIEKANGYYSLKKSIVINILNFDLISESKKYHSVFEIKERFDNFKYLDDLEIHYIELSKFEESASLQQLATLDEISDLEEWLIFLKECSSEGDEEVLDKLVERKETIGMAMEIMKKLSANELEYQRYLAREKYLLDEVSKVGYRKHLEEEHKKKMDLLDKQSEELNRKSEELQKESQELQKESQELKKESQELKKESQEIKNKLLLKLERDKEKLILKLSKILKEPLNEEYAILIKSLDEAQLDNIDINLFDIEDLADIKKYI